MRLRTIALSLVPGAAHVDLGRPGRGLLFFTLFAFSLNAALVGPLVLGGSGPRLAGALLAGGIWLVALVDAVRLAARTRKGPVTPTVERKEPAAVGATDPERPSQHA